ncbi:branched-chain amino acid transport system II carrier protein [Pseudoflavonifractor capillosus ATCC 29799]|uniref:Branched-chain amino acid transport system carrier protein n=1 Tax=Pseudoflavonifractor capillosus ATCC 29799 TaxID=411467 RepID=A6NWT9_9FIRM|nr:branched-chain amino acid transport system II carrier protein [Pseudoflavonifractor capillosus]EDM99626.1 branched-chain amino acid transport system II carrier protein [Pseudoflavonifractor capillosus ATCC 29799]
MKELKGKELLLVGFTLFSMFFGAGNLIFPPFTGAQAGTATWIAFAGLAVSAVGFPILGVVAVARSGGLDKLAGRVSTRFAAVFTFLIYLSIGPCLAIPRTASTSFEMAVTPFLGESAPAGMLQLIYSVLFFAAALALALQPERLTDRLGKVLCPILIALIVVLFVGCLVKPVGGYTVPTGNYTGNQAVRGFLDGYQTMDTIAALNFGIIIALNIKARGVEQEKSVVRGTIRAGWIAGAMLLVIYAMLAHIGAMAGGAFPGAANGAEILTKMVPAVFGTWGSAILAAVFVIACFNTCVGLISCCSEYFCGLFPRISYRWWAVFFAVVSMAVSNAGLNMILKVSVPVLNAIYPVAIVLILLSFCQKWLEGLRYVYPMAILFTGVSSVLSALRGASLLPSGVAELLVKAPLASMGLGWVIPAVLGAAIGILLSLVLGGRRTRLG